MPTLSLDAAERLAYRTLTRCGTSETPAASTARALVCAEADGLRTHGLMRLIAYGEQVRVGKVAGDAVVRSERPRPGLLAIDAGYGFAYPALDLAVAELPAMARSQGIAAAAIRNSHHCGVAGHPVEALAEKGRVALLFANAPASMAPWGGSHPVFGTNPIAFACPLPGRPPIVVDMSLSKVARGNIVAAKQRGESIPLGWAVDADGVPTTDPARALEGTMIPLGDAKGTALALMVEVLAAALVGARFSAEASSFLDAKGDRPATGQMIIALDATAFANDALERIGSLARSIEDQDGARLPGSRRLAARTRAAADGIVISDVLLAEIEAVSASAREVGDDVGLSTACVTLKAKL